MKLTLGQGELETHCCRQPWAEGGQLRHTQRHFHPGSVPADARHAPVRATDAVNRGRTVESGDASHEAGA